MLISNYITNVEKPKEKNKENIKLQRKYKRLQRLSLVLGILAFLSMLSNLIS